MPLVKIISSRFSEWEPGEIVGMDDEAARVPLENGEVELIEEKPKNAGRKSKSKK